MFAHLIAECRYVIEAATKADLEKTKKIKALQQATQDAQDAGRDSEAGRDKHARAGSGWHDAAKDWSSKPGHENFAAMAKQRARHHQQRIWGSGSDGNVPPNQVPRKKKP